MLGPCEAYATRHGASLCVVAVDAVVVVAAAVVVPGAGA